MSIVDQGALEFNRQGRLAPGQVTYLLLMILVGTMFFIIGAIVAMILIMAIIAHAMTGSAVIGIIFDSAFALLFVWLGYVIGGEQFLDLLFAQVSQVEGRGAEDTTIASGRYGGLVYWYSVGKESFQVSRRTVHQAPRGVPVRAYYTPRSRTLVNIEPLQQVSSSDKEDAEKKMMKGELRGSSNYPGFQEILEKKRGSSSGKQNP